MDMKTFTLWSLVLWFLVLTGTFAVGQSQASDAPDVVKRTKAAAQVVEEIMGTPDKGIPEEILEGAECIAVTPSMFNAGVGIGGRYGKGIASCRTSHGWSAPAPYTVAGGSWGLQFGAQAIDVVMLIMNENGMRNLLSSKFKIGADASAAAGPVGRHVAAGTDWKMRSQVLTYSRSRGVFAGVTLNGVAVQQDKDGTTLLYGRMVPFGEILRGNVATPHDTSAFVATLNKHAPTRKTTRSGSHQPSSSAMISAEGRGGTH